MLTLDTSALVSLMDPREGAHKKMKVILQRDRGPYFVSAGMLAETTYMIETRLGARALDVFLEDLEAGAFSVDWDPDDISRARALLRSYPDLALGFADAALIACAERNGTPLLTLDRRALAVVAAALRIDIVP